MTNKDDYCPECGGYGEQEYLNTACYKDGHEEEEYFCHHCGAEYVILIAKDKIPEE